MIKKKNSFKINYLSADKNYKLICKQILKYKPRVFFVKNREVYQKIKKKFKNTKIKVFNNFELKNFYKTDITISAIPGIEGLRPTLLAVKSCKKILIANKESVICGWHLLKSNSLKYNTDIVPVDSEHYSIFKLLNNEDQNLIKKIYITASGGPFLKFKKKEFKKIKPKDALKHPKWKMGKKISIDSATMVNKALEIIEAKYLFNLEDSQIDAIIHPQAVVHAMVNYKNGITTALLNKPDMRIPISTLFFKFNDYTNKTTELNLLEYSKLEFYAINTERYPAIKLGKEVMKIGGLAPNAFNYLNEILVSYFLKNVIKFADITALNEINLEKIFAKNHNIVNPKLIDIKNINNWIDKNLILKY